MNNLLVSVIIPVTADRAEMLYDRIRMFNAQDYPNKELIIVTDEGSIAYKRNLGCARAHGLIVIHFDSDDFYAKDWISTSVAALQSFDCDMTGLSSAYFASDKQVWIYEAPTGHQPYVLGATLCYWKSFWEQNKFPEHIAMGEDLWLCGHGKVIAHHYMQGFIVGIHANNTCSSKQLHHKEFALIEGLHGLSSLAFDPF